MSASVSATTTSLNPPLLTQFLRFNEPDLSTQSNISPTDAAAGYKTWMQPFAGKARLGAPAVTNGGSPMGLTWLENFLNACSGCTIDFVPIHWYDSATNIDYFKSYVQQAHSTSGKPIWITEVS
jgi:Glycosyl hydrolase catalytic core